MNNDLATIIKNSPLSDEDKAHWIEILPKLTPDQRQRLTHSLISKTNIAAAKSAIDRALKIIDDAEAEANSETEKEDAKAKAKEELMKEIEKENPMMPEVTEVEPDTLGKQQQDAEAKIAALRAELAQISQDAHGATPPSHN